MLRFLKKHLMALFKILKRWVTRQSASDSDFSFSFKFPDDELFSEFSDSSDHLSVDSLMELQDVVLGEILPKQEVKKLKKEYVEMLNHIINIKVSNLINRMNKSTEYIPLNTIIRSAKLIFPRIQIDGNSLVMWLTNTMDFNPDEALYMANLLSSHIILFTIVNHYLTLLNIGCFYRKRSSSSQTTYKTHVKDYDYAIYLCQRETDENLHGDLLNYKVKKFAKNKVDLNKWEFEFELADKSKNKQ
ncbi:uncharacterized protein LOC112595502 [Melanaphis sacchari]|uniref:uncharacterized protein LOC112595502 n=1 Tax=Melanaphis sacchari TaxID=742174 RepID=UPI000DC150B8|nr:uncharacterized protein LOC112595502 [Melanaphis sacchari]